MLPHPENWNTALHNMLSTMRASKRAFRYRTLRDCGLKPEEVVSRTTHDLHTGEQIGSVMRDYATSTRKADELPEPVPRDLRTIFAFRSVSSHVAPELRRQTAAGN